MDGFFTTLDRLNSAGDPACVEEHIRACLTELEGAGRRSSADYASILNELAAHYRGVSRFDESSASFEEALEILRNNGLATSVQYATVLLNLSGTYRLVGRPEEAISLLLEAKELLREQGAQNAYEYHSVLNGLALAYQDVGRLDDAFATAHESYEAMRQGAYPDAKIATALGNLASIRHGMGEGAEAEELIDEALALYERMPEEHVHHAAALSMKGTLLYRSRQFDEALGAFRLSLELTERFYGENIEYAIAARNVSAAHEALGDIPEALRSMEAARDTFERILGPEHPRVAQCRAAAARLTREDSVA